MNIVVAALYHFATLDDYQDMRQPIQDFCDAHELKGSLLLAREGINGLPLIYISELTRLRRTSYADFCLKKKKKLRQQ